jgi:ATP-dependent DNA helicase RecQ
VLPDPALLRDGVVVVSPLIALMQDQVDALEEVGVRAAFLNSTQTYEEASRIERLVRTGESTWSTSRPSG